MSGVPDEKMEIERVLKSLAMLVRMRCLRHIPREHKDFADVRRFLVQYDLEGSPFRSGPEDQGAKEVEKPKQADVEKKARELCFADCSAGVHLDPENGCCMVCKSADECPDWRPYGTDARIALSKEPKCKRCNDTGYWEMPRNAHESGGIVPCECEARASPQMEDAECSK